MVRFVVFVVSVVPNGRIELVSLIACIYGSSRF